MTIKRMPTDDLCEQIRKTPNKNLRIFVGAWMVTDLTSAGDKRAQRDVLELYQRRAPALLDKPGHLTDAIIAREVQILLEQEAERGVSFHQIASEYELAAGEDL